MIVLTNQCAGGQRLGPCQTDEPFNLATGIAAFYEPEYGLIARMRAERDPNPSRTKKLFDVSRSGERRPYRLGGGRRAVAEFVPGLSGCRVASKASPR